MRETGCIVLYPLEVPTLIDQIVIYNLIVCVTLVAWKTFEYRK